jgi:predicted MPP superfamily phosphohydrolase
MISRRTFLRNALLGSSGVAAGLAINDLRPDGYTGSPILEEHRIDIVDLPSAFQGYRIGFLTDIHLGIWVPQSWLIEALAALQRRDLDLLILGGDYIYVNASRAWQTAGAIRNSDYDSLSRPDSAAAIYRDVATIISRSSFPDGIIGVVGNHEHWNYYPLFIKTLKDFPSIKILINEEHSISRNGDHLHIFGVDDYVTGIPLPPPPRERTKNSSRLLISHNPDYIPAILQQRNDPFDFAMCGHTHGGQICLPVLGGLLIQIRDNRFMAGLATVDKGSVYTSRGLGVVGLPFRFNCPAEITIFELQRA